jgi:hypothetical protein
LARRAAKIAELSNFVKLNVDQIAQETRAVIRTVNYSNIQIIKLTVQRIFELFEEFNVRSSASFDAVSLRNSEARNVPPKTIRTFEIYI